ncbi:OsmC family protein [Nocardia cyriacigeorgica]|uniref:OsmC family protein n=1 Tax=Nocardia cyriacigeorgica TaxID=135487 RepID=UPI00245441D6|nr:OsmC family protein [Nocardia cyriacigeorgica]
MTRTTPQPVLRNGIDTTALRATIAAVRAEPELAKVTFSVGSDWLNGCHQRAHTGEVRQDGTTISSRTATYEFESDEPVALLGTDRAASPGEYILQALAGCYAVTFAANAAARDIELSALRLELEIDFDLRGFLAIDDDVRPGAQHIRVTVHAKSPNASETQLRELTDEVQRRSPIRDTLANPVVVTTSLAA